MAYRVDDGTVLRGGYGLYWDALTSNSQYTQHNVNTWPVASGFNGKANDLGDAPQFDFGPGGELPGGAAGGEPVGAGHVEQRSGSARMLIRTSGTWNCSGR